MKAVLTSLNRAFMQYLVHVSSSANPSAYVMNQYSADLCKFLGSLGIGNNTDPKVGLLQNLGSP